MVDHMDGECKEGTKLYLEECCEPDDEGEYEDEDGQVFVVRRLMLTPKADDETRHKLFCTRCTINQ